MHAVDSTLPQTSPASPVDLRPGGERSSVIPALPDVKASSSLHPFAQALARRFLYLDPANSVLLRIVHRGSIQISHRWIRMAYLGALVALVFIGMISLGGLAEP